MTLVIAAFVMVTCLSVITIVKMETETKVSQSQAFKHLYGSFPE